MVTPCASALDAGAAGATDMADTGAAGATDVAERGAVAVLVAVVVVGGGLGF
jgi:hypothetical protein